VAGGKWREPVPKVFAADMDNTTPKGVICLLTDFTKLLLILKRFHGEGGKVGGKRISL